MSTFFAGVRPVVYLVVLNSLLVVGTARAASDRPGAVRPDSVTLSGEIETKVLSFDKGGAAFVLNDWAAPFPLPQSFTTVDAGTSPEDAVLHYPDNDVAERLFAYPTAIASGDLNDDGVADIVLNDVRLTGVSGTLDNGAVHIVFGPIGPGSAIDLMAGADLTIRGAETGELLARSIGIGDVTGDGIDDLVLLAPSADGPAESRLDAGEAYVFRGPLGPGADIDLASAPADTIIYADGIRGRMNMVVIGDITGDGVGDIVFAGGNAALVVAGPVGLGSVIDLEISTPHASLAGAASEGLGSGLALADVSGDGVADLLLAAANADGSLGARIDSGEVLVFFGPLAAGTRIELATTAADVTIGGARESDRLDSVWTGDLNGDGSVDVVMASSGDGPTGNRVDAGAAYIVFGPLAAGQTLDLARDADVTIHGADAKDFLEVALPLDVTGDGIDDLLLGAVGGDGPGNARTDAGEVHLLRGPIARGVVDLATAVADLTVFGREGRDAVHVGDWLGYAMAAGDFTGDGDVDLLLGAAMARHPSDPLATMNGDVHVVSSWSLNGGNHRPDARHGGPYDSLCKGRVLGILLDATQSFDRNTADTLSYRWSTTCVGTIFAPDQSTTAVEFECHPCWSLPCEVTVTVSDQNGGVDSTTTTVETSAGGPKCLDIGNSLLGTDDGGDIALVWAAVAPSTLYELHRWPVKAPTEPNELGADHGNQMTDGAAPVQGVAYYSILAIPDDQTDSP